MDALAKREVMTEAMLVATDIENGHDMTEKLPISAHHAEMQLCSYNKDHQLPIRARVALFSQLPGKPGERPKHLRPSQNPAGDWTDDNHGSLPLSISTIARLCRLEPDEEVALYRWIDQRWPKGDEVRCPKGVPDYDQVLAGLKASLAKADEGKEWDEKREGMIDFIRDRILEDPRESAVFDTLNDGDSETWLATVSEQYEDEAQLIELDPVDDPLTTLEVQRLRRLLRDLHDRIAVERAEVRGIDVDEWRADEGHAGHSEGTHSYAGPAYEVRDDEAERLRAGRSVIRRDLDMIRLSGQLLDADDPENWIVLSQLRQMWKHRTEQMRRLNRRTRYWTMLIGNAEEERWADQPKA